MTIDELRIQLDIYSDNKLSVLNDVTVMYYDNYLFVDLLSGKCYLFNKDGNEINIKNCISIKHYAFWLNHNLTTIIIPNNVESIGDNAFEHCSKLINVLIPNSVKIIGKNAFAFCENLKSIEIPNSVKSIGNWAFDGCKSLKSLIFKGKTFDQIKVMKNYSFGIEDESIIKCI